MSADASAPVIDLVLPTIGRTWELERLLESLAHQSYRHFRLIVVDQNADGRLVPILGSHEDDFPIVHVTSTPGLSRARNAGLRHVEGHVVGFPDDDCWYPVDLLARVADVVERHPDIDGVSGKTIDRTGRPSVVLWAGADHARQITRDNVWRTAVSVTIFVRTDVAAAVGGFDESIGSGSGTGFESGDETDFVLRAIDAGFRFRYDPSIHVYHDSPRPPFTRTAARRAFAYGRGNGLLLRRHGYSRRFVLYRVAQLVAGSLFFLVTGRFGRARFYWSMALGRAAGWLRGTE